MNNDSPDWLKEFLNKLAETMELPVLGGTISWEAEEDPDVSDNAWRAKLFPTPVLIKDEVFSPEVAIDLLWAVRLFDSITDVRWEGDSVLLAGIVNNVDVTVEFFLVAPEGVSAGTKMNPDGSVELLS
jgi:hypothetical protein